MDTIYKAEKIRAGHYRYRGVLIYKHSRLGFVFTVHPLRSGWYYGGMRTLAFAIELVDSYLNEDNRVVKCGGIWTVGLTTGDVTTVTEKGLDTAN